MNIKNNTPLSFKSKYYSKNISNAKKRIVQNHKIQAELKAKMPKTVQTLYKMKSFVGEIPTIIILGLSTGIVAPFLIVNNFLSKTDKDTRKYTAMRQPLSAILAVTTQGGLVIPFDKFIHKASNEGLFPSIGMNRAGYQDLKYITKKLKKEQPSLSKKELKQKAQEIQTNQFLKIMERTFEKGTLGFNHNDKNIELGEKKTQELSTKTINEIEQQIDEKINQLKNNKEKSAELKQLKEDKKLVNILKKKISDGKSLKDIIKDAKNLKETDFVFELVKNYAKNIESNLKANKQVVGIILSLIMLPGTVWLLNYIYPRFMDKFFPKLAAANEKPSNSNAKTEKAKENPSTSKKTKEVE